MLQLPAYILLLLASGIPQSRETPLYNLSQEQGRRTWYVVTDAVLGGTSRGTLTAGRGNYALFSGTLVSRESGGWVSVWSSDEPMNLSSYQGLALRLRGDGRTYRVALKMERGVDAIQYMARVTPPRSGWSVVRIRFKELVPMFHGSLIANAPRFNPRLACAVGVMIADGQDGFFELLIESVSAYAD